MDFDDVYEQQGELRGCLRRNTMQANRSACDIYSIPPPLVSFAQSNAHHLMTAVIVDAAHILQAAAFRQCLNILYEWLVL